eukprot:6498977-Pyramimonas_sp.AAC.1
MPITAGWEGCSQHATLLLQGVGAPGMKALGLGMSTTRPAENPPKMQYVHGALSHSASINPPPCRCGTK